jgi:hypothetical protein
MNVASSIIAISSALPLLLSPIILVIALFTRSWIALGILTAFAMAMVVVLCLGTVFATWSFRTMLNYR